MLQGLFCNTYLYIYSTYEIIIIIIPPPKKAAVTAVVVAAARCTYLGTCNVRAERRRDFRCALPSRVSFVRCVRKTAAAASPVERFLACSPTRGGAEEWRSARREKKNTTMKPDGPSGRAVWWPSRRPRTYYYACTTAGALDRPQCRQSFIVYLRARVRRIRLAAVGEGWKLHRLPSRRCCETHRQRRFYRYRNAAVSSSVPVRALQTVLTNITPRSTTQRLRTRALPLLLLLSSYPWPPIFSNVLRKNRFRKLHALIIDQFTFHSKSYLG